MAKALLEEKLIAPGRDRLPWRRAQLYYDPGYLATPQAWAASMRMTVPARDRRRHARNLSHALASSS